MAGVKAWAVVPYASVTVARMAQVSEAMPRRLKTVSLVALLVSTSCDPFVPPGALAKFASALHPPSGTH